MSPEEQLFAARDKAMTLRPWYTPFLSRLVFVKREGRQPLYHDQFGRVYYNDDYVGLTKVDVLAVLLIQIAELLARGFHWRRMGRDQQIWSIACLLDTASSLQKQGFQMPRESIKPGWFHFAQNKAAEYYYRRLEQLERVSIPFTALDDRGRAISTRIEIYYQDGKLIFENPDVAMVGGIMDGEDDPNSLTYLLDPLLFTGLQEDMYNIASEFGEQMVGDMPDWLIRRTNEQDSVLPWHEHIRLFFGEHFFGGASSTTSTYARPSLLADVLPPGVILPYQQGRTPSIALVVDTSWSMNADMLSRAVAEIDAVLRAMEIDDGVWVIPCDAAVHSVQKVYSGQQLVLEGGGGTRLEKGFDKAKELSPRPEGLIVITDGYTPWPKEKPDGMDVLVVNVSKQWPNPDEKARFPVPSWVYSVEMFPWKGGRAT